MFLILLWQISLFQRSKANHNNIIINYLTARVVANIIISKIESKSQLPGPPDLGLISCGKYHYFKRSKANHNPLSLKRTTTIVVAKYHYFKDRKQITTYHCVYINCYELWQISLFQRSKANHNILDPRKVNV